jgi:hypothetical protein
MNLRGIPGLLFTAIVLAIGWLIGMNVGRRVGLV